VGAKDWHEALALKKGRVIGHIKKASGVVGLGF